MAIPDLEEMPRVVEQFQGNPAVPIVGQALEDQERGIQPIERFGASREDQATASVPKVRTGIVGRLERNSLAVRQPGHFLEPGVTAVGWRQDRIDKAPAIPVTNERAPGVERLDRNLGLAGRRLRGGGGLSVCACAIASSRFILDAQLLVAPAADDESAGLEFTVAPLDRQFMRTGAESDRLARRLDDDLLAVDLHIGFGAVDDDLDATIVGGHVDDDAQRDQGE